MPLNRSNSRQLKLRLALQIDVAMSYKHSPVVGMLIFALDYFWR